MSFRGSSKQDEAKDMLGRAANLYKMAKKWNEAGETFCKIASHQLSEGNKHDAATNYVSSATCEREVILSHIIFIISSWLVIFRYPEPHQDHMIIIYNT